MFEAFRTTEILRRDGYVDVISLLCCYLPARHYFWSSVAIRVFNEYIHVLLIFFSEKASGSPTTAAAPPEGDGKDSSPPKKDPPKRQSAPEFTIAALLSAFTPDFSMPYGKKDEKDTGSSKSRTDVEITLGEEGECEEIDENITVREVETPTTAPAAPADPVAAPADPVAASADADDSDLQVRRIFLRVKYSACHRLRTVQWFVLHLLLPFYIDLPEFFDKEREERAMSSNLKNSGKTIVLVPCQMWKSTPSEPSSSVYPDCQYLV